MIMDPEGSGSAILIQATKDRKSEQEHHLTSQLLEIVERLLCCSRNGVRVDSLAVVRYRYQLNNLKFSYGKSVNATAAIKL